MKTIAYLVLLLMLSSCQRTTPNIVIWKSYHTFIGNPMPIGICRYCISGEKVDQARVFEDSCKFYHINDTIR